MEYNFRAIEKKWQQHWKDSGIYKVPNNSDKPKYYVLDMFPYPSGAGLHVGHPLGYIASDIFSRYKRLKGFNVLHPMGFDSFGLPAEQYALETGQHPAVTTEKNIARYIEQLNNIGFCYDWSREVRTSDASYYKWTQWIFLQLFNAYYDRKENKAKPIAELIKRFEAEGSSFTTHHSTFTNNEWIDFNEKTQQDILMNYRLAYCGYGEVNWCEALGTVLANDEVVNGLSERGGHPVVKKKLRQWYLRITAYADRLLDGLKQVEFSDAMKDMQTNWIGKSKGAEIAFEIRVPSAVSGINLTPNPSPRERGTSNVGSEPRYETNTIDQWKATIEFAKLNRRNPTETENILWEELRNRNIDGCKFRRQHPVAGFIPDFVCIEKRLIVEIDGEYHSDEEQKVYDEARTKWLDEHGYILLRFTNEDVNSNLLKVIDEIKNVLSTRDQFAEQNSPSPLERGSGGEVTNEPKHKLTVYTTRPDTIFGVDFMVVAPELDLINEIKSVEQSTAVEEYIAYVKSRSDVERMAEKKITGCFTGAYAINPFDGREIPIWISEYVLAGYGTGAIMAVPCGDERDFKFAKHFNIPITNIIGSHYNGEQANATKEAILENSGFLNGLVMKEAMEVAIKKIEELGIGKKKVNYRMRDAAFSRQRYWGEPFPITWKDNIAKEWEGELPLQLPHVETYSPGPDAQGPLANIPEWVAQELETNTMPGYAGSSWYFLRYMDPHNNETFCDRKASDYWNQVDLYIGGTEHAVGHLLYSRMWTKALFDLGHIGFDEPFKKLMNQGMIQGSSRFVFRFSFKILPSVVDSNKHVIFISKSIYNNYVNLNVGQLNNPGYDYLQKLHPNILPNVDVVMLIEPKITPLHVDVSLVDGIELDIEAFKKSKPEYAEAVFILEDETGAPISFGEGQGVRSNAKYICGAEVEKMSKSKYNVVNPDDIVEKFGADTFRMYEMFLGPVEQSKPWDTKGIEGVHRFLRKFWRLFVDEEKGPIWTSSAPSTSERAGGEVTAAELKVLHRTIKKIEDDTERFSFNTAVSAFMVCVNDLNDLKCHKREILEPLAILLTPYAPHIAEELYQLLQSISSGEGRGEVSVLNASFPILDERHLVESAKEYPISINGKVRTNINISLDATQPEVEEIVLANEQIQKWLEGKPPKKIIFVKGKMINVVV